MKEGTGGAMDSVVAEGWMDGWGDIWRTCWMNMRLAYGFSGSTV